jgi:hypothetical protein
MLSPIIKPDGSDQLVILVTKINYDGNNTYLDTFKYNDGINLNKRGLWEKL